jgi:hypothetical protein
MDNTQITLLLRNHPIAKRNFVRVVARDRLISCKAKKNDIYIVNLSQSTERGSHWVLLSFVGEPLYLCSSGSPPVYPDFYEFFSRAGYTRFYYNKVKLQDETSNVCGAYVCVFAVLLASGFKLEAIRNKYFTVETKMNDRQIVVLFKKLFGTKCVCDK